MRYIGTTPNQYGDTLLTSDANDQINVKVAGAEDFRIAANTLSVLSGTTLNIDSGATIANSGTATGFGGGGQYAVVASSKNIADASGSQSITGAGFQPTACLVIAGVTNDTIFSIGFTDGTTEGCISDNGGVSAGSWDVQGDGTIIAARHSSGNVYGGNIDAFTADGVDIDWTKYGSPTGTMAVRWIFFG
jgi:hypothetical protein